MKRQLNTYIETLKKSMYLIIVSITHLSIPYMYDTAIISKKAMVSKGIEPAKVSNSATQ